MMPEKSVQQSQDGESSPAILPPLVQRRRTDPGREQRHLAHLLPTLRGSAAM
jgi:hypothetical protein